MDLTGETLGQFRIVEPIGQGGMASVFKAYQPSLDRYVAIKVLPAQHALTPGFSERFEREARAIAQLNHPNILPVIDFGQADDLSYIVMKYVPVGTLKDKMGRPMDLDVAVRLIDGIAAALDHAHERGILHRDIKPSNVLLDEGDWVLLADFGLAKIVAGEEGLTGSGVGIGTPAYMSPEQGQGVEVDARTDIYALGVILYEMVTGRLPYDAETPFAIVMKHITEPLPLPRSLRPELPEGVERVILKALAKQPADRFESAGALAQALRAAVTPAGPVAPRAPVATREEMLARLPDLYTGALGYFYTEQWERAIASLEAIVDLEPDYEGGDAARRLERAREQVRLAELYAAAEGAIEREQWGAAVGHLNGIVALDADYRDAAALLKRTQGRRELADLYQDARRLHDSGQWEAVVGVWEHIHALDPEYADPEGLLVSAQSELDQIRADEEAQQQAEKRARRLAELYRRGLEHVTADEWAQAAAAFEEIERLEPGYQETPALLERARQEVALRQPAPPPSIGLGSRLEAVAAAAGARLRRYWPVLAVAVVGLIVVVAVILTTSRDGEAPAGAANAEPMALGVQGRAFVSDRDGKPEIYRVTQGGEVTRWTHSPADSGSWSPLLGPNQTLFFVSNRSGKREIFHMDRMGEVVQWTFSPAGSESWGPVLGSDNSLFFVSDRTGEREIYRMDRSGEVLQWTSSPAESESWAPARGRDNGLFFVSDRSGKREIYRMDQGGDVQRWTFSPADSESWGPVLGPDGSLFFVSDRDGTPEIYRMDVGGAVTRWTQSGPGRGSWAPVVGADGLLTFTSDRDGKPEVYGIDRSGSVVRLTDTPAGAASWTAEEE